MSDTRNEDSPEEQTVEIPRHVGFFGAVSFVVGGMIGSGIFISPKGVYQNGGSVGIGMMMWLASGILSMFGALCYIEIGTMIPKSGGEFYILLEGFGPIPAYLFAWTSTFIVRPAVVALLALTFAEYTVTPLGVGCGDSPAMAMKLVAGLLILTVVALNCYSAKISSKVVTIFSVGKTLSLAIIIVAGIVQLARGHTEHLQNTFVGEPPGIREVSLGLYQGLWAFGGWSNLNYIIEEIKNPFKIFPSAIVVGLLIVTGLYFLTNVAYLSVMSLDVLLASPAVGATFAANILGVMAWIIPVSVACSVFGTCLALCFATARTSFVAAREGHFNQVLAMIHIHTLTPAPSLILLAAISILMLVTDFDTILNFLSFASWSFRSLAVAALLFLRYRKPDLPRPFKVPLPIPIIFVIASTFLVIAPIIDEPDVEYLIASCAVLLGLCFYFPFVHFKVRSKIIRRINVFFQKLLLVTLPDSQVD